MKIRDLKGFKLFVHGMLRKSISDDYSGYILTAILGDVIEDVECCADENWNEDDVRLAVGRSLCDRLGIEI